MPWLKKTQNTATATIPLTEQWRSDVDSSVIAYRSGDVVTVAAWRLAAIEGATGSVSAYSLPMGFRPAGLAQGYSRDSRGKDVALGYTGNATITNPATIVANHSFTFVTLDPMPKGGA